MQQAVDEDNMDVEPSAGHYQILCLFSFQLYDVASVKF